MKYGEYFLSRQCRVWSDYYLNYELLKEAIDSIKDNKFDAEADFLRKLQDCLQRTNDFYLKLVRDTIAQMRAQPLAMEPHHHTAGGTAAEGDSGVDEKEQEEEQERERELDRPSYFTAQDFIQRLVALDDFGQVNTIALRKILKKHDKHSKILCSVTFGPQCLRQNFCPSQAMEEVYVAFSNWVKPARDAEHAATKEQEEEVKAQLQQEGRAVDDSHADGVDGAFSRQSVKFLIKPKDATAVVLELLRHLPNFSFGDFHWSQPIESVYFDNDAFDYYHNRIRRFNDAALVRIRTYGKPWLMKTAWLERKLHKEGMFSEGHSVKDRFQLPTEQVLDFVQGKHVTTEEFRKKTPLYDELQQRLQKDVIFPRLRTTCNRVSFQFADYPNFRLSLDSDLQLIRESVDARAEWFTPDERLKASDFHRFPFLVLEAKIVSSEFNTLPPWYLELIDGPLLIKVEKFSKFCHGAWYCFPGLLREAPYWVDAYEEAVANLLKYGGDEEVQNLSTAFQAPVVHDHEPTPSLSPLTATTTATRDMEEISVASVTAESPSVFDQPGQKEKEKEKDKEKESHKGRNPVNATSYPWSVQMGKGTKSHPQALRDVRDPMDIVNHTRRSSATAGPGTGPGLQRQRRPLMSSPTRKTVGAGGWGSNVGSLQIEDKMLWTDDPMPNKDRKGRPIQEGHPGCFTGIGKDLKSCLSSLVDVMNGQAPPIGQQLQHAQGTGMINSRFKIEPKTMFANERTFLRWMLMGITLIVLGCALLGWEDKYHQQQFIIRHGVIINHPAIVFIMGWMCLVAGVCIICFALFQFHRRLFALKYKINPHVFVDHWGPTFIALAVVFAAIITGIYYLAVNPLLVVNPLVDLVNNAYKGYPLGGGDVPPIAANAAQIDAYGSSIPSFYVAFEGAYGGINNIYRYSFGGELLQRNVLVGGSPVAIRAVRWNPVSREFLVIQAGMEPIVQELAQASRIVLPPIDRVLRYKPDRSGALHWQGDIKSRFYSNPRDLVCGDVPYWQAFLDSATPYFPVCIITNLTPLFAYLNIYKPLPTGGFNYITQMVVLQSGGSLFRESSIALVKHPLTNQSLVFVGGPGGLNPFDLATPEGIPQLQFYIPSQGVQTVLAYSPPEGVDYGYFLQSHTALLNDTTIVVNVGGGTNVSYAGGTVFPQTYLFFTTAKYHSIIQWDIVNNAMVQEMGSDFDGWHNIEPAGVMVSGRTLVVCNRGNLSIVAWDIPTGTFLGTIVDNLPDRPHSLFPIPPESEVSGLYSAATALRADSVTVKAAAAIAVTVATLLMAL